jgi:hypothetical protein
LDEGASPPPWAMNRDVISLPQSVCSYMSLFKYQSSSAAGVGLDAVPKRPAAPAAAPRASGAPVAKRPACGRCSGCVRGSGSGCVRGSGIAHAAVAAAGQRQGALPKARAAWSVAGPPPQTERHQVSDPFDELRSAIDIAGAPSSTARCPSERTGNHASPDIRARPPPATASASAAQRAAADQAAIRHALHTAACVEQLALAREQLDLQQAETAAVQARLWEAHEENLRLLARTKQLECEVPQALKSVHPTACNTHNNAHSTTTTHATAITHQRTPYVSTGPCTRRNGPQRRCIRRCIPGLLLGKTRSQRHWRCVLCGQRGGFCGRWGRDFMALSCEKCKQADNATSEADNTTSEAANTSEVEASTR